LNHLTLTMDQGLWPDFEPFDFDHGPRALAWFWTMVETMTIAHHNLLTATKARRTWTNMATDWKLG
jgi:hypothetical protein